jgi:uncharacterized protein YqeY
VTMPGDDLQSRIDADLKQAMRERDEVTKLTLRAVKTALTEARTSGAQHELSADEVLTVVQKEAKRRRDAAAEYERLGDANRASAELVELAVLERYLPRQLSEAEVEVIARRVIAGLGATSPKQMGAVMAALMPEVKGEADGKLVSQVVRRLLGS